MNTTDNPTTEPTEGDAATFLFTATGGASVTLDAEYITGWQASPQPCIELADVSALLNAWYDVDPDHRKYDWPSTDRTDDDAFIAFATADGRIVLDRWTVANDRDRFSLDRLPELLPIDQYTLTRSAPENEPNGGA